MPYVLMMESTYRDLATRAVSLLEQSGNYRIIILLIGAPGSGKSTIAQRVVDFLNEEHRIKGHGTDTVCSGGDVAGFNDDLPEYDPLDIIDIEDEDYRPTIETVDDSVIIRGRGGDDTSLKLSYGDSQGESFAQVIPMDGFHLPREVLSRFKDPINAIKRRGSPFTFDSSLIVRLVSILSETLKVPNNGISPLDTAKTDIPNIFIPSFDHSEHDPKRFGTRIDPSSRILIMEGLYLLLDNPVWCDISRVLEPSISHDSEDETIVELSSIPIPAGKTHEFWKILIDDEKLLERVGKRHLKSGIVKTLELGKDRVKINDLPNGLKVYKESFKSDINIISIDDANEL